LLASHQSKAKRTEKKRKTTTTIATPVTFMMLIVCSQFCILMRVHAIALIKNRSKRDCQQKLDDHLINVNDDKNKLLTVKFDEKNISDNRLTLYI
jgi:low affinity Fe/Cu permease